MGHCCGAETGCNARGRAYTVRNRGTLLGFLLCRGEKINARGTILASAERAVFGGCETAAFTLDDHGVHELVPPGGGSRGVFGLDLNDQDQVTGFYYAPDGGERAFTWDRRRGFQDIGSLAGKLSEARAINNRGQVVGGSEVERKGHRCLHAFLYDAGRMIDLGEDLPGASQAYCVNDNGQVGLASTDTDGLHAYLWAPEDPNGTTGTLIDVGPPDDWSIPLAINRHGQVLLACSRHGYVWTPETSCGKAGALENIGNLGGEWTQVCAMNDHGQVVGISSCAGGTYAAFVWDAVTGITPLPVSAPSGWILYSSRATAVNARGQIAGTVEFRRRDGGGVFRQASVWDTGTSCAVAGGAEYEAWACDINDEGRVTGGLTYEDLEHVFEASPCSST